jgi:hypothetical protein
MVASPGYANQPQLRTAFRIGGLLVLAVGVTLTVVGFLALFDTMGDTTSDGPPSRFFLAFAGLPLMAVGGWLLQAGFGGVAARYAAGELAPVAKETLDYIKSERTGPYCSKCGVQNDTGARFCDACGTALA